MSGAPELLPCPFCGSTAQLHTKMLDERFGYAREAKVKCQSCGVSFLYIDDQNPKGGYALNGTGQVKSVAAWNRRADLVAAKDARIAELERQLDAANDRANRARLTEERKWRSQLAEAREVTPPKINWRDDPTAIVEDDEPQTGRDYA